MHTDELSRLKKQLNKLKLENAHLKNSIEKINAQHHALDLEYRSQSKKYEKYKKLVSVQLIKPLIKFEQLLHALNAYRKGFRYLSKEKGGYGEAYHTIMQYYKQNGFKLTKVYLRQCIHNRSTTDLIQRVSYEAQPAKFVERSKISLTNKKNEIKVICFYLPQFHPFPENDKWWGKGFTEWSNVKPAVPQYRGHYQPRVPHEDIGYYSLLDKATQLKQVELAKQYGIEGFCYYLYWFSGHRLMETPLDNMLADKEIDFPFCVCWANENWSRRWDGLDQDILIAQNYSDEDDIEFIKEISKYLKDKRYIHIDGKPLLLIYRPNLFPNMQATVKRWRKWCIENGIGEIYLAYPQSFEMKDPTEYGFDAAIEFPPNNSNPPKVEIESKLISQDFKGVIYDWRILLERSDSYTKAEYKLFRSANPSWDNTARKKSNGIIFENSCPNLFEKYLVNAFSETMINHKNPDERLVFINAWNEWAEGAYLEPDQKYGYAWLQAVQNTHLFVEKTFNSRIGIVIHAFYLEILEEILDYLEWAKSLKNIKLYITTPFSKSKEINEVLYNSGFNYHLQPCENLGRDVLPFIKTLPQLKQDNIEYIIKVHTKRSLHRHDGDEWRQYLYSQILSQSGFNHAMHKLTQKSNLSMISPRNHLLKLSDYLGSNKKMIADLCKKSGINFNNTKDYKFIAGTMFYAKMHLFENIIDLNLNDNDFENEQGQIDGTLAHALERYFGVLAKELGCEIEETSYLNYSNTKSIFF